MSKYQNTLQLEVHDFLSVLKKRDEARAAHEAAVAAESNENKTAGDEAATLEAEATSILNTAKEQAEKMLEDAVRESERIQKEASEKADELRKKATELQASISSSQADLVTQTYIERRAAELMFEREQQYLIALIKEEEGGEDPTPRPLLPLPPLPTGPAVIDGPAADQTAEVITDAATDAATETTDNPEAPKDGGEEPFPL